MKTDSFNIFDEIECVMVVMPHPDDTELYCGGTIARLVALGKEVICIKMTNGGKGTQQTNKTEKDFATIRSREDKKAAAVLGLKIENNIQLEIPDGEIENDLKTIENLASYFRKFRPDMLITCNPEDVIIRFDKEVNWVNHRDHRLTARTAIDAAYPYSRDTAFFPSQLKELNTEFNPTTLFLLADYYNHPDLIHIDVTDFIKIKTQAWQCHTSVYSPDVIEETIELLNLDKESGKYFESFRYVVAD